MLTGSCRPPILCPSYHGGPMNAKFLLALVAELSLAAGVRAQGADRGWYVGVDAGQSRLDTNRRMRDYGNVDNESTSYTVRVGYRFIPWFALEGGYTDLGQFSGDLTFFCPAVVGASCPPTSHQTSALRGPLLNAVAIWPLAEHFQLNASLGAIYRDLSVTSRTDTAGSQHWSDKDTVVKLGFGIGIPINSRFEVALDYVEYRDIGLAVDTGFNATVVNDGETSVTSLGLRWRL